LRRALRDDEERGRPSLNLVETNELLRQIVEALSVGQSTGVNEAVNRSRGFTQVTDEETAPAKFARQLCCEWFAQHPEHLLQSSRWLARHIKPEGRTISNVTWAKAKRRAGRE
jgi:hypothetical protein